MMRAVLSVLLACAAGSAADGPQRLIVDTDMGFDVDDVVAVCLANSLHMNGKARLLAVVHNTGCALGIGGVSAINHFYGHDNVTLGAWKGKFGSDCNTHFQGTYGQNQYLSHIIDGMGGPVKDSDGLQLGVDAYRKVLAAAPNASVNIASIGMPTNLADLLESGPDSHSPLSGYDLIEAKVHKIVFMDGGYNFGCAAGNIGPEYECHARAQAAVKMPPSVRLIISGKGEDPPIYTASQLQREHPPNSPCREALKDWCCNPNGEGGAEEGRLSWDPIAVMIAALDVGSVFEKEVNVGTQITVDADGTEHFFGSGTRNALTDFNDNNAPSKIVAAIDGYVNQLPSPGPTKGWVRAAGQNCYGARDGQPAHGATDLESPPSASCGVMSLADCQARCLSTPGCDGVTVSSAGNGQYNCFRKGSIELAGCDGGTWYDTYVHVQWAEAKGANCYGARDGDPAHGATDLESPPSASCGVMSLVDCQARCLSTPGCDGVTVSSAGNGQYNCFRKGMIRLGGCDGGTNDYDTYLAAAI
eukprot:Hpha_TRINITY_DN9913_c0_g1::TRINITY_DN9913_c0_g1_i1::g.140353::m.140353